MIFTENRKRKVREEDWVCSDPLCGNINFFYRNYCNKCETNRDEYVPPLVKVIGKKAAAKSNGIFKDLDWQCNACENVNWARRQKCNNCETDKFDKINMIEEEEDGRLIADPTPAEELIDEPIPGTSGGSGYQAKKTGNRFKRDRNPQKTEKSENADKSQTDWLCKICGNVSWPRKDTCGQCHAVTRDVPTVANVAYYDAVTDDDSEGEINEASRNQIHELGQELQKVVNPFYRCYGS
ncbi:hypothetical protein WDU94_008089 [Cyamophila willieti]